MSQTAVITIWIQYYKNLMRVVVVMTSPLSFVKETFKHFPCPTMLV